MVANQSTSPSNFTQVMLNALLPPARKVPPESAKAARAYADYEARQKVAQIRLRSQLICDILMNRKCVRPISDSETALIRRVATLCRRIALDSLSPRDFTPQELPFTYLEHVTLSCSCSGKQCIKCGQIVCVAGFFHDKRRVNASSVCLPCHYAYHRAHGKNYRETHQEENAIRQQNYYQAHKEQRQFYQHARLEEYREHNKRSYRKHREKFLRRQKTYAQVNHEKIIERNRIYRQLHPERYKAAWNRYAERHPERLVAKKAKRRTLKMQTGGSFTEQEWIHLKAFYNHTCLCCGKREPEIKLYADHVIPVIKGGHSNIDNIQPLCGSCNSRKHVKIIDYRGKRQ